MSNIFKIDPLTHSFVRPNLILEKRNGEVIGKLIYENLSFNFSGKGVDEFSITIHKNNDGIECTFWDSIKDLAIINWQNFGRFVIDIQVDESNETTKVINCISLEGDELGQPIIRNLHINDKEAMTTLDPGNEFKPTYLYIKNDPMHSLLDRIINAKTKHWQIGHVDNYFNINGRVYKACNLQREFTIDGKSPYDVLEQEVAKECGCIFTYDTYNRIVNCYNAVECVFDTETMEVLDDIFYDLDTQGYYTYDANNVKIPVSGNYEYCDGIGSDTTIILTRERLSENVTVNSDKDSIKNCFYVTGGDDVITNYVASANASGNNYIYNFDYQYDLMSDALVQRLKSYKEYYKQKEIEYNKIGGVYVYDPNVTYDNTKGCYIDNHGKIIIDDNVRIVNNRICVLSPYSYYEDGECYNEDGTVITTTHTYDEPGLFIKFCQANDRLAYWDHNKFPNMTPENTTAEAELQKIKTYFQSNPLIITNAAGTNSFAHVSLLIKDMCNVITDNRYSVTVDNTTTSCDQINDSYGKTTGYWEGKISVVRDADKEDYDEDTIRILVKKSQNGAEDKDYCDQKIKIALKKMDISELPLTYNMSTTDNDNELREMFSQYNLTSLKGFRDSFDGCLSVLDDLQNQMLSTDDERQGFISRAFEQAFRIYKNRYNICVEYSGKSATERTSDTTVIGITEATVNKWTSVVDDYTNQIIEFQKQLSLETYLGNLYTEFLSFVREDEYNNGNYNSDGLSDSELLYRANELREVANAELRKASQIHYTLNGTINNIFNIDELKVIKDNFEIFNYVRYIADGRIFKLRLLGISGDENSLDTISVTFSDVISVTDMPGEEVKKQLDTAQAMSTTYSSTTLQARQGSSAYSSVDKMKTEGLNSAEYIIKNSNAEVIHDDHGSLYKNMDDTSVFSDNQLRITPAGMYLTDDAWQTTGMAVGTVIMTNPSTGLKQKYFGVIADYIYGTLLAGNGLEIANENGSVNITGDGIELDGGSITWKTKLPQSSVTDLVDDLAEITSEISELDDRIETFSQTTDPSADWTTTELKEKHLSDLWFNPTDGLTKRWTKSGTTYKWETVTDSDLVALAQSKATVFVSKPTSGYRAKDLWILEKDNSSGSDSTYPQYKKGSVLISNTTSTTYNKVHWHEDVRYTDDTLANQALADARQGIADAASALNRANAVDTAAQGYANTAEQNAKNASDPRGSASSAESNAKTYADNKDSALSTTLTTAYQNYVGSAVGNLDHAVADYLNLSGATSIYTAEYAISPYIGGGYVNVSKGSGRVIIDPSNQAGTGYILAGMKTSGTDQGIKFGIDSNGNAVFTGAITATSLTITDQTKVTGMKIPKTYVYAYANSTTNTQPADSAFSSTQNPEPGKYMWIRTTISYTDSTITPDKNYYSTYIGKNGTDGKDGTNGTNGNDGASVTAVRVMYARSSSNSTAPTSGWSETRPTLTSTYKYVWVREDYKYSTAHNTWVLGTPRFDSIITAECGVPLVVESTSTGVKVHPIDNTSDYLHITSDSVNVAINNYTKAHFGSDGIWIGGKSNTSATSDSYAFKVDTNGNGYFSGELKAATGTFAGSLSAASGNFTGTVHIDGSNTNGAINIHGNNVNDRVMVYGANSKFGSGITTYSRQDFEKFYVGINESVTNANHGILMSVIDTDSTQSGQGPRIYGWVGTGGYSSPSSYFELSANDGLYTTDDITCVGSIYAGSSIRSNSYISADGGITCYGSSPVIYGYGTYAPLSSTLAQKTDGSYYFHVNVANFGSPFGINCWVSDTKLKKNITSAKQTALDKIKNIDFIQFNWKDSDKFVDLGVSANQVEKIIPNAVFDVGENDENSKSIKNIDTGVMTTYALKAIQEQQEIIEKLEQRIKQLEESR